LWNLRSSEGLVEQDVVKLRHVYLLDMWLVTITLHVETDLFWDLF
jgi:hypothetical protein